MCGGSMRSGGKRINTQLDSTQKILTQLSINERSKGVQKEKKR